MLPETLNVWESLLSLLPAKKRKGIKMLSISMVKFFNISGFPAIHKRDLVQLPVRGALSVKAGKRRRGGSDFSFHAVIDGDELSLYFPPPITSEYHVPPLGFSDPFKIFPLRKFSNSWRSHLPLQNFLRSKIEKDHYHYSKRIHLKC